jgi:hypothetical protein
MQILTGQMVSPCRSPSAKIRQNGWAYCLRVSHGRIPHKHDIPRIVKCGDTAFRPG